MTFVAEKENEFITYYVIKPRNGIGCLVSAFNGQQAIAKADSRMHWPKRIVCVQTI